MNTYYVMCAVFWLNFILGCEKGNKICYQVGKSVRLISFIKCSVGKTIEKIIWKLTVQKYFKSLKNCQTRIQQDSRTNSNPNLAFSIIKKRAKNQLPKKITYIHFCCCWWCCCELLTKKKIFIPEDVHSIQLDIKNIALNFAYEREKQKKKCIKNTNWTRTDYVA